jgi:hypothetical protein
VTDQLGALLDFGGKRRETTNGPSRFCRDVGDVWTMLLGQTVPGSGSGTLVFDVVGTSVRLFWNNALVAFANDAVLTAAGRPGR